MQINDVWKKFQGDFNAMTDTQIDWETKRAQDVVDEQEEWLEAVAAWTSAGRPRAERSA